MSEPEAQRQDIQQLATAMWKLIAVSLGSILFTGITAWLSFGMNRISRPEALELVRDHAPYVADKQFLFEHATENRRMIEAAMTRQTTVVIDLARALDKITSMQVQIDELRKELRILKKSDAQENHSQQGRFVPTLQHE